MENLSKQRVVFSWNTKVKKAKIFWYAMERRKTKVPTSKTSICNQKFQHIFSCPCHECNCFPYIVFFAHKSLPRFIFFHLARFIFFPKQHHEPASERTWKVLLWKQKEHGLSESIGVVIDKSEPLTSFKRSKGILLCVLNHTLLGLK